MKKNRIALNEEQKKFIEIENSNVLVSASAGSGKTTTMIEKILDLLRKGVSLDEIMAITFTNASANDMRQKLFNKLLDEMQNSTGSEKDRLSEELDKINVSDIGTLHSICKKIILKYYYAINLNPEISIATEGIVKNLLNIAITNTIKKINKNKEEEYYPLFEIFNGKRKITDIYYAVIDTIKFLESIPNPDAWLKSKKQNIKIYFDYIYNRTREQITVVLKEVEANLDSAKAFDISTLIEFFGRVYNSLQNLLDAKDFEQLSKRIFQVKFPVSPRKGKKFEDILDFIEKAQALRKKLIKVLEKLKNNCIMEDFMLLKKVSEENERTKDLFIAFVLEVQGEYKKLKADRKLLDFNDLESFAYEILQKKEAVDEIKEKYKYIFVDEYQDINHKQDSIIFSIAKDHNTFLIGDVKQCIYAFRRSTPEIFLDKYNKYPIQKAQGEKNEFISLNRNYRSEPEILSFVNDVFDELITEKTVGIDYKKDSRFVIDKKTSSDTNYSKVKMLILDKKTKSQEDEEDKKDKNILADESYEIEANIVIREIIKLVQGGEKVLSDGTRKKIEFKDIVVLLRDQVDNAKAMYNAFVKAGIPVVAKIKEQIFDCPEVLQLYSFMKALDNSFDDYSLATALLSPMGGMSENELAEIKLTSPESRGFFYEIVMKNKSNPKIGKFLNILKEYRFQAMQLTMREVVEKIVEDYDLFNFWRSQKGGLGTVIKVKEFIKLIDDCLDKYSLREALDYLGLQKDGEKQRMQIGSEENSVKIMTIHDSKGLEFPVVFLCTAGKGFNKQTQKENLIISNEVGLGIKSFDVDTRRVYDTVQRRACLLSKIKEDADEQIRLLYVALTRAKCALRIVGTYDLEQLLNNRDKIGKYVYACNNFLEFIFRGLSKKDLHNFIQKSSYFKLQNGYEVQILSNVIQEENDNSKIIISKGNKKIEKKLKKCYQFKYPESPKIATKNTVTSLLQEDSDYTQISETVTSFELRPDSLGGSAQEVGTLYHKVMERMNYSETDEQIKKIIVDETSQNITAVEPVKFEEIKRAVRIVKGLIGDNKIIKEAQFIMRDEYKNLVPNSQITEPVIVQGVVDLIIINGEKATIIDFKTNRSKSEEELREMYKLQLDLYSLAVKDGFRVSLVDKYIYSFKLGKLINI